MDIFLLFFQFNFQFTNEVAKALGGRVLQKERYQQDYAKLVLPSVIMFVVL